MKVVIVNTYDIKGGAAIASKRLQHCLKKTGLEVDRLVIKSTDHSGDSIGIANTYLNNIRSRINFYLERLSIFLCNGFNKKELFKVSFANTGFNITDHSLIKEADIIHLHWINHGFLSIKDIRKLLQLKKPVLWTMHDLWPATGTCHYPGKCKRYTTICRECPLMGGKKHPDMARIIYKEKEKSGFNKIYFIGCSNWITEEARKSNFLQGAFFTHISNPIDTTFYKPLNKLIAREQCSLPEQKKLLLFVADNIQDTRKGIPYLIQACKLLKEQREEITEEVEIVLLGKSSRELTHAFSPFRIHSMGYVSNPERIIAIYSAVDLFIIPSLEDNLPNTVMEAMACSIPCCGFDVGGIPEMIDHKLNGYIAKDISGKELAEGINWTISHPNPELLQKAARSKVEQSYNERTIAKQYTNLYEKVMR